MPAIQTVSLPAHTDASSAFERLQAERRDLKPSIGRNRDLSVYSLILGLREIAAATGDRSWAGEGIVKPIKDVIAAEGRVIYADFACGNGAALREAKLRLQEDGLPPESIVTYGVDAIEVDAAELQNAVRDPARLMRREILAPDYEPRFQLGDIRSFVLPERPHIVTCVEALCWVHDGFAVFTNAARQLRVGGLLMMNRLETLYYTPDRIVSSQLRDLYSACGGQSLHHHLGGEFPGFRKLAGHGCSCVLRKEQELDFTYGLRHAASASIGAEGLAHLYAPA